MRINKFIAETGYCSRRKADQLIESKAVTINARLAKIGDSVTEGDIVRVHGEQISREGKEDVYIILNKPVGVICTADESANNTVFDYVDVDERLFYVGRLDVHSSGLVLLTNNGNIANKIASPKFAHEKEYIVSVDKPITRKFLNAMRNGVYIEDQKTLPAHVKKMSDTRFKIILTEGRNRQIRKMTAALGYEVRKLKRVRIMHIKLRELGEGNWRYLTKNERRELLEAIS